MISGRDRNVVTAGLAAAGVTVLDNQGLEPVQWGLCRSISPVWMTPGAERRILRPLWRATRDGAAVVLLVHEPDLGQALAGGTGVAAFLRDTLMAVRSGCRGRGALVLPEYAQHV